MTDLADALDRWAREAREQAQQALDEDEIGKAARLRGRAEGFTIAAAEIRRG